MSGIKTVTFKEMELLKEGYTKAGKPWSKYNYYGDDGEHYVLFGKLELEKPYKLAQKTREFGGKTYTDWIVVPEGGKEPGSGVKAIMDKMDGLLAEIQDVKRVVMEILKKTPEAIDPSNLPF